MEQQQSTGAFFEERKCEIIQMLKKLQENNFVDDELARLRRLTEKLEKCKDGHEAIRSLNDVFRRAPIGYYPSLTIVRDSNEIGVYGGVDYKNKRVLIGFTTQGRHKLNEPISKDNATGVMLLNSDPMGLRRTGNIFHKMAKELEELLAADKAKEQADGQ